MSVFTPRALTVFKTVWSVAVVFWLAAGVLALLDHRDAARIAWAIAMVVTFTAFVTSFVILAQAAIKLRTDDSR